MEPSSGLPRNESELLERALVLLGQKTGFKVDLQVRNFLIAPNHRLDAVARLTVGNKEYPLFIEIRETAHSPQSYGSILSLGKRLPGVWMVVAPFISPVLCARLKHSQIGYIDLTGNFYLPLILEEQAPLTFSEDHDVVSSRETYRPRIQTDSVLQLLLYFLTDPETLTATQRQLADLTGVSASSVNKAIAALEDMGFLAQEKTGNKLLRRKSELIQRWSIAYYDGLRREVSCGRFRPVRNESNRNWFHQVDLHEMNVQWGGEPAAAIYTKHLTPELYTLYFRGDQNQLMTKLRLAPSDNGEIELLRTFWSPKLDHTGSLAPPLVVYADLIGSGNDRNRETAKVLYDQFKLGD